MSRTTSRGRAAGIGLGALAAVALVASPVAAAPAEDPVVLELDAASPEDLYVSVYGEIDDEDQASVLQAVPVPPSGAITFAVQGPVGVGDTDAVVVELYDVEAIEESGDFETPEAVELVGEVGVSVEGPDADGTTTIALDVPLDDPGLVRGDGSLVDDVQVSVLGLEVEALPGTPVDAYFPLDLRPSRLAELLLQDPGVVAGYPSVDLSLPTVPLTAGSSIRLTAPEGSVGEALGVGTFGYVDAYIYPADEEGWTSWSVAPLAPVLDSVIRRGVEPVEGAAAEQVRAAVAEVAAADVEDEIDEEDLTLETEVAPDGRSALLTTSAGLPGGSYYLSLGVSSAEDDSYLNASGAVDVTAAAVEPAPEPEPSTSTPAPRPTPTVTVTAPAVAPPAATAPRRQNPGLRSNTGVETATVPGLSDGQLVGLGAGLLVLGSAAGAVALRSQRRARA